MRTKLGPDVGQLTHIIVLPSGIIFRRVEKDEACENILEMNADDIKRFVRVVKEKELAVSDSGKSGVVVSEDT